MEKKICNFQKVIIAMILLCFQAFSAVETSIENWNQSAFGDLGGQNNITKDNFILEKLGKNKVAMSVIGNKGKISSGSDGLFFLYDTLPKNENFELKAKVSIENYDKNNQVSFGLMVRDKVLIDTNDNKMSDDCIALGPLGLATDTSLSFNRKNGILEKKGNYVAKPLVGDKLDFSLKKMGNLYLLKAGNQESVVINNFDFAGDNLYVGLFVARNAKITFENISLERNIEKPESLKINNLKKTKYLLGENISLKDLEVKAIYENRQEKTLNSSEYVVTNYSNDKVGKKIIEFNFNGAKKEVEIEVLPLKLSEIEIVYEPIKTKYYMLDSFSEEGLVVNAVYNNGYKKEEIRKEKYDIFIDGKQQTSENPYIFNKSGNYKVTLISKEDKNVTKTFNISVNNAKLKKLEIRKQPLKTKYFIGENLDLNGLVVYAIYSDNKEVKLSKDELTINSLDTSIVGEKNIKISYKGKSENLKFNVKDKEPVSLVVSKYPKTTFSKEEKVDFTGMEISILYDNGETQKIEDFKVDKSQIKEGFVGEYIATIEKEGVKSTKLGVSIRETATPKWEGIVFGQSTVKEKNSIKVEKDKVVIEALEGGGKITGDHDGISFYYTELDAEKDNFTLTADIKVLNYAKNPHDGQEAFGIMARDVIGQNLDSAVVASNIGAIGGFSGGSKDLNGIQLYSRSGVENLFGKGSLGIEKVMISEFKKMPKGDSFKLTLSKTNSGFVGKIGDGKEFFIFAPEILKTQNNKMYIGFFTARLATIEVSNISLVVSSSKTDEPKMEEPKKAVEPKIVVESLKKTSEKNYDLVVKSNVTGSLSVKLGNNYILENKNVIKDEKIFVKAILKENDLNKFRIVFSPEETEYLTNYDKIIENFEVENRKYQENKNIYVSTKGTSLGDGSIENPLDLDTAIDFVLLGQKIIVKEGHYVRNKPLVISKYNDGTDKKMKSLIGEKGKEVVIDFNKTSEGVIHSGNYWHIYNIEFKSSAPNTKGYTLGGSNNIIELCKFYENGDTGLQISRTDIAATNKEWPSNNLILNCTSFDNRDPAENNADGFAAKLTSGTGNIFDGCIAHNNIDDGWDLYTKLGTGAIGAVIIRNSVAYNNGYLQGNTSGSSAGDGNGFKLGGEGIKVEHLIENSVAFGNTADGFTSNSNPGVKAKNNISFNNFRNISFATYGDIKPEFFIENFISFHKDNDLKSIDDFIYKENENKTNYIFKNGNSINSFGAQLSKEFYENFEVIKKVDRKSNGEINFDFLEKM